MIRGTTLRRFAILSELLQKSRGSTSPPATKRAAADISPDEHEHEDNDTEGPSPVTATQSPPLSAAPSTKQSIECLLRRCVDVVMRSMQGTATDASAELSEFDSLPVDMKMWILRYAILQKSCTDAVLECLLPGCSVQTLSLRGCTGITDSGLCIVIKHLGNRLRSLDLCNCSGITAYGLQTVVRHCTELEHLVLSGCPAVTDEAIPIIFRYHNPGHIRTLELRHCFLRDTGLTEIGSYCPSLHRLDIRCCGLVTPAGVDNLTQRVPHLTAFNGGCCVGVDDRALGYLARGYGASLTHLDCEMCWRVTSTGVAELARECRVLQSLNLRGCSGVDDAALDALAQSALLRESLRELDVSGCDIGDETLESFVACCRALVSVRVVGCSRITPARAARLAQLADVRIIL